MRRHFPAVPAACFSVFPLVRLSAAGDGLRGAAIAMARTTAAAVMATALMTGTSACAGTGGGAGSDTVKSDAAKPDTVTSKTAAPPAEPTAKDDQGRVVTLEHPAERAITLAPHATELVYEAGAGGKLAGTVKGSDYPPQAKQLPSIGDGTQPDAERVAAMRPDLIVAWLPGAAEPLLPVLRALNVPIFYSDPRTLADIPDTIDKLGVLFGTSDVAGPSASALRDRLRKIEQRYQGRPALRVFIQAGREPLYTLNRNSIVNDAVRVCGGVNVFADGAVTAPQVSLEAVLAARPDAVVAGVSGVESLRATAAAWNAVQLPAALAGHVFGMDADVLYRPGPRLIAATEALCEALDRARPPR